MKKINLIIIIVLSFLLNQKAISQEYKHNLNEIKKIKIVMSGSSDINVKSSNSSELLIHYVDFEVDDDKKGLRAINSNKYDNSSIGLSIEEESGVLVIRKLKSMSSDNYDFSIPSNMPFSIKNILSGDIKIEGFSSEIEVKTLSGDININNISGPILANSISGDIKVFFDNVAQNDPMSLVSVSGDIELLFTKDSKANLVMKTLSGTAFTDVKNLEIEKEKTKAKIKKKSKDNDELIIDIGLNNRINAKLNGGGVEILTKSISGDIIIREK